MLLWLAAALHGVRLVAGASAPWSSITQSSVNATLQLQRLGPIPFGPADAANAAGDDDAAAAALTVEIDPTTIRQRIHGFGGAFTEVRADARAVTS